MTTEWVTVPREPTEAMVAAGRSYAVPSTQAIIPIYTAMLSASPVPPSEPVGWRIPLMNGQWQLTQHADIAEEWRGNGLTVLPLYAVPPSPPRDEVVEALRSIPDGAIEALRNNQRQLDMDGVEVGVSRQAVDEVLTAIDAALTKLEEQS